MTITIEHRRQGRLETLTLDWPLSVNGEEVDKIQMRRLTGGEVAALQDAMLGDGASEVGLVAAFCDQPADVIAQLDADDFLTLKDRVADFLPQRIRRALEAALTAAVSSTQADPAQS